MIGWRRWAHLGLILAAVVVIYFVVPIPDRVDPNTVIRGLVAILMVVLLAAGVVRQFRRHLDNADQRVDGLIVSITVVMTVFAFSFYVIEQRDPSQFAELRTRLDALYFAAATGASVGYGDVHAAGQLARGAGPGADHLQRGLHRHGGRTALLARSGPWPTHGQPRPAPRSPGPSEPWDPQPHPLRAAASAGSADPGTRSPFRWPRSSSQPTSSS